MAAKPNQIINRKTASIITTGIAVILGILIVGLLVFKFVPGFSFFVVKSGSMTPAIGVGNVVFTGPVGNIGPGTIITFNKNGEIVTHRVYSIDGNNITTKGDANPAPDAGTITISDIKGVYLFQIPGIGYVTQLAGTKKGWFFMVIVPSALLVLFLVKDILKEAFKNNRKKPASKNSISQKPVKTSRFSFLMFDTGDARPAVNEIAKPVYNTRPAVEEPVHVIAESMNPSASVNLSSNTAYQNISHPAVTSLDSSNAVARDTWVSKPEAVARPEKVQAHTAQKKPSVNPGCVFSSKEANDKVKNELRKLLINYN